MKRRKPPRDPRQFNAGRRRFLVAGMGAAAALGLPGCTNDSNIPVGAPGPGPTPDPSILPNPEDSGIDHIVQIMMENRSFDHMLGWVPGATAFVDRTFKNADGADVRTFHLNSDPAYGWQGCDWADPNHGYEGGRTQYNDGKMDGFLLTGGQLENTEDKYSIGYYNADDVPFYKGVAEHFTVCDRYFHGILSSTFPNRIYIHAGTTDRNNNALPVVEGDFCTLPTIWDRLIAKGVSCKNYFGDLAMTMLWGEKYLDITSTFNQFLVDAASGMLPSVSYFDPTFGFSVGEEPGLARDDHPHSDIRDGQAYLNRIYQALSSAPTWSKTLMIVTYDEWGGFFDHVPPPVKATSQEEHDIGNLDGRLGFRTPCVMLGPRVRRNHVSKIQFDPQSVIDLITWRFGLEPLGHRAGALTNNMALALDFINPPREDKPVFDVPMGPNGSPFGVPFATPCDSPISLTEILESLPLPGAPAPSPKPMSPSRQQRLEHLQEFVPLYLAGKKAGYF